MIEFDCPHCRVRVEIEEAHAGRRGRCPGCQRVIEIPSESGAPGESVRGYSTGAWGGATWGEAGVHGPREMSVPESVAGVEARAPEEPEAPRKDGRPQAVAGLVLGLVPIVSLAGIVFGGVGWRRASRARAVKVKRLAIAGTVLSILMTLATGVLMLAALVSGIQALVAQGNLEECQSRLGYVGGELESYAASHSGEYPPTISAALGHGGYIPFYSRPECAETGERFEYVRGLKQDPSSRRILMYDAKPAHGIKTWLHSTADGRNVYRLDGSVDFLEESKFQSEMSRGGASAAGP